MRGLSYDYIVSLTHLYRLVHKEKVVEIHNMQKKETVEAAAFLFSGVMGERRDKVCDTPSPLVWTQTNKDVPEAQSVPGTARNFNKRRYATGFSICG
ncbi:hypothetical protein SAMN05216238_105164 [Lentibacillus persicus]|uniref:Uncharacterized protein n=1 Tax=Lentibacillus persicus TaxID=640948 RepID=A0A1I1W1J0_9BACI|nr:hypothetical protein SAMN05216238_105164 [Lentibacillus persicus]